jgi:hypothetical protein
LAHSGLAMALVINESLNEIDMRHRYLIALSAVLATSVQFAMAASSAQVFIDNNELNYVGSLSEEANRQAFALFDSAQKKPAILSIRSKGGPTDAGMELGRWVHAKGLTVKVMEYCFSSCANYVFTAAPRKVVSNVAVVGYHGGLSSTSFTLDSAQEAGLKSHPAAQREIARAKLEQSIRESLAPQVEAERAFFSLIGVQQRITTLGQAPDAMRNASDKSVGWTYSVEDFAKLGVRDIRVVNPPWQPGFVNTDAAITVLKVN